MQSYSFKDVSVLIDGVEIRGFAEGDDVIQVKRRNPSHLDSVGADGEMVLAISADLSGEFLFKLQQTSNSNAFLSALVAASESGANVPLAVVVKDNRGNDLHVGVNSYITKPADDQRGTNPNEREWLLVAERLDMISLGT
jgi:hypothetical protein